MDEELDTNLRTLFREQRQKLPEEPFLSNMLKLIEKQRSRQAFRHKFILVLALACCAFLSPLFIRGSILLSGYVGRSFEAFRGFVEMPAGVLIAVLCCMLLIIFFRRRLVMTFIYRA
jgi:hypothetical protein